MDKMAEPFWRHSSFEDLLTDHPELEALQSYFTNDGLGEIFPRKEQVEEVSSSYLTHAYHYLFYGLTRILVPEQCVELGVLRGFSLLTFATALHDNGSGLMRGFDLFEDYPFKNASHDAVVRRIREFDLQDWAVTEQVDAFDVHHQFDEIDLLHVDLSNDGDTYRRSFSQWAKKVKKAMIFEGGSPERDKVEWMVKYEKPSIVEALAEIRADYPAWNITVLDPFPSVTVAIPRR